jgi:hypothetical protein
VSSNAVSDTPVSSNAVSATTSNLFEEVEDQQRASPLNLEHREPTVMFFFSVLRIRIRDPVPFFTPGSGMGKKSGSGMNNPAHISESLETIFWG